MTQPDASPEGPVGDGFELSLQQEHLFTDRPDGPFGRATTVLCVPEGELPSADALRAAAATVVERHEILRTRFVKLSGLRKPLQVIDERGRAEVVVHRERRPLDDLLALDTGTGDDLFVAAALLEDDAYALVLSAPATKADHEALAHLGSELAATLVGQSLAVDPLQYADYAAWQREQRQAADDNSQAARRYWVQAWSDEVQPTPPLRSRPGRSSSSVLPLDQALSSNVSAVAPGAPEQDGWLALWLAFLARRTGAVAITVALLDNARTSDELAGAVGPYCRVVPLHVDVAEDDRLTVLLSTVGQARDNAVRAAEQAPLLPVAIPFAFEWQPEVVLDGVEVLDGHSAPTAAQVTLVVRAGGRAFLRVDPDQLSRASGEWLRDGFEELLGSLTDATTVDDLAVVSSEEQEWLFDEIGTGGPRVVVVGTVPAWIAEQARRTPERVAVAAGDRALSYGQLDQRANQVAHLLRELGVGRGHVVAICQERTVDLVTSLAGVHRAGAAYLPLNSEHPAARLAHQLADTGASVIITQEALLPVLPPDAVVVCVDRDAARIDAQPTTPVDDGPRADDTSYVMYTSGSTGAPKGVVVSHGALAHYTATVVELFGLRDASAEEALRFGMVTTTTTDLGNTCLFPSLATGGTLDLVPVDAAGDGAAFAAHVAATPLDVLKITPSHLSALLAGANASSVLPRRLLVLGGEALSWRLADAVTAAGPCEVVNHYGPTEATVGTLWFPLRAADATHAARNVPIGRPFPGSRMVVLDSRGRAAPLGAPGELYVSGPGLADGYWRAPEQTAEKFVDDIVGAGERFYRTGDIVRVLTDGVVEFLGRDDDQVKVRGFRVELAEVEAVLRHQPSVRQAVVVFREGAAGGGRLAAYVVPESPGAVTPETVLAALRSALPDYMVPASVSVLEALPLLPNGKVDRLALPEPTDATNAGNVVLPETSIEREIAAIWADVLEIDVVGAHDDFFMLGGHSLLAALVLARIREAFQVQVPLHAMFTAPTVAELAELVTEAELAARDAELALALAELENLSDEEAEALLREGEA